MVPIGEQTVKIPATIFPGVFDREYQVAVDLSGKLVNLTVSEDFVELTTEPSEEGTPGFLKVNVLEIDGDNAVIALPGEVQGATSRATADRRLLQVA